MDPSAFEDPPTALAGPAAASSLASRAPLAAPAPAPAPQAQSQPQAQPLPQPRPPPPQLEEFIPLPDPFLAPAPGSGFEPSNALKAAQSCSKWNGLLRTARRDRANGVWDWATGMYHVDSSTPAYYSGVTRLAGSSLPAHLQASQQGLSSSESTPAGTPAPSGTSRGGGATGKDETYDSGRPRRRAAMGR